MKNTQLRIGTKVLHNGVIKTIDLISPGYVAFLEDRPNKDIFGEWVDLDEVEFIELTEEILLKFGFLAESIYSDFELNNIRISSSVRRCDTKERSSFFLELGENNTDLNIRISKLHQLQNLYYALTDEELKINL